MFCFFFSSRRRHTRFDCDWSSDVCSSDLAIQGGSAQAAAAHRRLETWRERLLQDDEALTAFATEHPGTDLQALRTVRSEERRVGKECRSRGSTDDKKKKEKVRTGKRSVTT